MSRCLPVALFLAWPLLAQPSCPSTPVWSPCDLAFDLQPGENAATVQLRGEFRSSQRTYLMPAFRDGNRLVLRFSPTEPGIWSYRLTSNVKRLDGTEGRFSAGESDSPGFVRVANVHHFQYEGTGKGHLWMATALDRFVSMPRDQFDQFVDRRAKEKFTHLRVTLDRGTDLREAAERIRAINAKGITADLALGSIPDDPREREQYITDIVARFAAMNVTWMGIPSFENTPHNRAALKDAGAIIAKLDPYQHPRTTLATTTSGGLLGDGWMTMIDYGTPDPNIGAVEHQLFQVPGIDSGIHNVNDLWNATMNGQYPASGSGQYMTAWFDFMSGNRYWELEPYFDAKGGRAIALDGVEYIVYMEKPGPVSVKVESHGYDIAWINPETGERIKEKGYKGGRYTGEPPDTAHPWVLHISREGAKGRMLKSWKFESRPVPVQEIEQNADKIPFEIDAPAAGDISISYPPYFALKARRETPATKSLLVEWTGEVLVNGEGYRVIGTGREGTMHIPASVAPTIPTPLSVRVALLNAYGKAYVLDRIYRLIP
ncbi:MAG: DUF5060 domain-containing protein [Bryobacteraceae bacterium]